MDELKAYLLPCNLEQLNDRINSLGLEIARMGENETLRVRKAFLIATLGYMEELLGMRREEEDRRAATENNPLSLEQLRQMNGEPVWIKDLKIPQRSHWWVVEELCHGTWDNYGKTWLAYARKPEQEE